MEKFIICLKIPKQESKLKKIRKVVSSLFWNSKILKKNSEKIDLRNSDTKKLEFCLIESKEYDTESKNEHDYFEYYLRMSILQNNYLELIRKSEEADVSIRDIKFNHYMSEMIEDDYIQKLIDEEKTEELLDEIKEEIYQGNEIKLLKIYSKKLRLLLDFYVGGMLIVNGELKEKNNILEELFFKILMGIKEVESK